MVRHGERQARDDHVRERFTWNIDTKKDMLDMEGTGWDGDLEEMRATRFPDW